MCGYQGAKVHKLVNLLYFITISIFRFLRGFTSLIGISGVASMYLILLMLRSISSASPFSALYASLTALWFAYDIDIVRVDQDLDGFVTYGPRCCYPRHSFSKAMLNKVQVSLTKSIRGFEGGVPKSFCRYALCILRSP